MIDVLAATLWAAGGALLGPGVAALARGLPQGLALREIGSIELGRRQPPAADRAKPLALGQARTAASLVLATLFGGLVVRFGLSWQTLLLSLYAVIFVLIVWIDLQHRLILNRVLGPAAALALAASPLLPHIGLRSAVIGGVVGFVLFFGAAVLARGGLGEGDIKLAGVLGLMVGYPGILAALAAGVLAGGLTTVVLLLARRITARTYIAYGPFLIIGACIIIIGAW